MLIPVYSEPVILNNCIQCSASLKDQPLPFSIYDAEKEGGSGDEGTAPEATGLPETMG